MSAIHVSLFQDSHLQDSWRGITHIASQCTSKKSHRLWMTKQKRMSFLFTKATYYLSGVAEQNGMIN
jgi:hypothetical protein